MMTRGFLERISQETQSQQCLSEAIGRSCSHGLSRCCHEDSAKPLKGRATVTDVPAPGELSIVIVP